MKIISIDYGLKKIWTAILDTNIWVCMPWELFKSKNDLFTYLLKQDPEVLLIWHPKTNESEESKQEYRCLELKNELEGMFNWKQILLVDERMTTIIAKQKLKSAWISQKKWKGLEDCLAALIILETYHNNINEFN